MSSIILDGVWALFRELVEAQKETDRKFQENAAAQKETDRMIKQIISLGNWLNEFVGGLVKPVLVRLMEGS